MLIVPQQSEKWRGAMSNAKILIVDDDADLSQGLKLRLRANHHETVHAGDGYATLSLTKSGQV
jgi:DNA-binding response OmpR family regulator